MKIYTDDTCEYVIAPFHYLYVIGETVLRYAIFFLSFLGVSCPLICAMPLPTSLGLATFVTACIAFLLMIFFCFVVHLLVRTLRALTSHVRIFLHCISLDNLNASANFLNYLSISIHCVWNWSARTKHTDSLHALSQNTVFLSTSNFWYLNRSFWLMRSSNLFWVGCQFFLSLNFCPSEDR